MRLPQTKTWHRAALLALAVAGALGWLAWQAWRNPAVMYLPEDSRAEWILFPAKVNGWPYTVGDLQVVFRREFVAASAPRQADLSIRAARKFLVRINGREVQFPAAANWKKIAKREAGNYLTAGTNLIEVAVVNDVGPALLWADLEMDGGKLPSDTKWMASAGGSAWNPAIEAGPNYPGPGNASQIGEGSLESLKVVWPWWAGFVLVAAILFGFRERWTEGWKQWWNGRRWLAEYWPLIGASLVIGVLFLNNIQFLRGTVGFDVVGHRNYIAYLQEHHALPWPNEGWEMFQPPLYYAMSALGLGAVGSSVKSQAGEMLVRGMGLLIAVGQCALIFLALRRLLPNRAGARLVGFALAAFVPMNLYMVGAVGNEPLEALLVSLVIWWFVRLMDSEVVTWRQAAVLGLAIGLGMLAKVTMLLVFPILLLGWAARFGGSRERLGPQLGKIGVTLGMALLVCGWYYARIWAHYGKPLVGNWDPASGFNWWQIPGYHTAGDYLRFGRSLVHPFFSALSGFPDGIYSTLFGDGEYLGQAEYDLRPPWNYHFLAAGYLLALAPAVMVLAGAVLALVRWVRKPEARQFALLGICGAVGFGILHMSLKVASFTQIKAFYGLGLLIPFGYFAALGWEWLTRKRALVGVVLGIWTGLWCANSAISFFVVGNAAAHFSTGALELRDGKIEPAAAEFAKSHQLEPANSTTSAWLANALLLSGHPNEAREIISKTVADNPRDFRCHLVLGAVCDKLGKTDEALAETRRAVELGPESMEAIQQLTSMLARAGLVQEASAATREGLAVEPRDVFLHDLLGRLLIQQAERGAAREQFEMAATLDPDFAPAHLHLGQLLLEQGDYVNAGSQFIEYRRRQPDDPEGFDMVGLAHAGLGNYGKALTNLLEAARLAPENATILGNLAWLESTAPAPEFRNGPQAVQIAERACALTGRQNGKLLGVLAAACAETGRFADAIRTAQESIALAQAAGNKPVETMGRQMLAEFQANRPFRQGAPAR